MQAVGVMSATYSMPGPEHKQRNRLFRTSQLFYKNLVVYRILKKNYTKNINLYFWVGHYKFF